MTQDPAPTLSVPEVPLRRRGAEPLHTQIERALRAEIVSARWPSGSKLPPEPELSRRLGVNRGTLRRALAGLTAAGWLTATRGRGTFVTDTVKPSIAQRFRSLSEDLADQGVRFTAEVLSATVCRPDEPERSPWGPTSRNPAPVFRLARVFLGAHGPLAYLVNRLDADRFDGIADIDFTAASLFSTLSDRYGVSIARGRRSFAARAASGEVAEALALDIGAPVLYVEQVSYTGDGDAVEWSEVWINSDRVAITSFLERDAHPA